MRNYRRDLNAGFSAETCGMMITNIDWSRPLFDSTDPARQNRGRARMSMDLSLFYALRSNDDATVRQATDTIMGASQEPSFITFLFAAAESPQAMADAFLHRHIQLQIRNIIRRGWAGPDSESRLWSDDQQSEISSISITLALSLPAALRMDIIAAFETMIVRSFPLSGPLAARLIDLLDEHRTSIEDVATLLSILSYWCAAYGLWAKARSEAFGPEALAAIDELNLNLITRLASISADTMGSIHESDVALEILRLVAKASRKLLRRATVIVLSEPYRELVGHLIQAVVLDSDSPAALLMRAEAAKGLYFVMAGCFDFKRKEIKDPEARAAVSAFNDFFKAEIGPHVVQALIQCLHLPTNDRLSRPVLDIVCLCLRCEYFAQEIVTPDFPTRVLLRYARLTEEAQAEAEENPNWYLAQYLNFENERENNPRSSVPGICRGLVVKHSVRNELAEQFLTEPVDIFDFEAKVYLLTAYIKALKKAHKKARKKLLKNHSKRQKKRAKAQMGPYVPEVPDGLTESIVCELEKGDAKPAVLQTTLIWDLCTGMKHHDAGAGASIALQIIAATEWPLVAFAASKLYVSCCRRLDSPPAVEVGLLLPRLLSAAQADFSCEHIAQAIMMLCQGAYSELQGFAFELIGMLLETAFRQVGKSDSEKEMVGPDAILTTCSEIVSDLPDDSEIVCAICDTCEPMIWEFFERDPDVLAFAQLFTLLGTINAKLTTVRPVQFAVLRNIVSLCIGDETMCAGGQDLCWAIYPLVTARGSPITEDSELCEALVHLCDAYINQAYTREICGDEALPYYLFLASCLVQVFGAAALEPLRLQMAREFAFEMDQLAELTQAIESEEEDNPIESEPIRFVSACHILAAGLVVDPVATAEVLPPEMVDFIIANICAKTLTEYREMKIGFIILLNFTRFGKAIAYEKASNLYEDLVQLKIRDEATETEEEETAEGGERKEGEEEEEEEDEDEIEKLLTPYYVPFDDYDVHGLYAAVSQETGLFAQLSPDLQEKIRELTSGESES
jgi:hypothetical protein